MRPHEDPRLVAQGYRLAKQVARQHAKSFFFASYLLFGARRRAAFALYAFCRRLDDMVDEGGAGVSSTELQARLQRARRRVAEVYLPIPELAASELGPPAERLTGAQEQSPWDPAEFAALRDAILRFRIPEQPFQELISGMEMDLAKSRYATFEELDLYCYRVAGVIGLKSFGLSEDDLRRGQVDDRWRDFMRFQIARARRLYASAGAGVPYLQGFGSQRMVRLMGGIYGDILRVIEARDYDVFSARAWVPGGRKLALAAAAMARPSTVLPTAVRESQPVEVRR